MPIDVTIRVDVSAVVRTLQVLSSPRLERAAAAAINDTAKNAQVQGVKVLAPMLGLKSRDVKQSFKLGARAVPAHLETSVICTGRPIPLIQFRTRDTHRGGVTVQIAHRTETFRRAFITTMKTGHRGVFERFKGGGHLPIRELYGPSAAGMYGRHDIQSVVLRTIDEKLVTNLRRQVDRQLRAAKGLAGSKSVV